MIVLMTFAKTMVLPAKSMAMISRTTLKMPFSQGQTHTDTLNSIKDMAPSTVPNREEIVIPDGRKGRWRYAPLTFVP